ncbi:hypothetical protein SVAN01_11518 [Stagonosporopsis vannaccii]|nr:hypothetical protein SVAN01_11518 [Stagonosporopsis vannaccii]
MHAAQAETGGKTVTVTQNRSMAEEPRQEAPSKAVRTSRQPRSRVFLATGPQLTVVPIEETSLDRELCREGATMHQNDLWPQATSATGHQKQALALCKGPRVGRAG